MTGLRPKQAVVERDVSIGTLALTAGDVLTSARLHYRTLGTRRVDDEGRTLNAILLLHGTTGSGAQFLSPSFADAMFGPGQALDITRWFVVIPDALGHGDSSKPSDGLWDAFPSYGYCDMVAAQRLVLQRLGIERLVLVLGTSMGGMQTWMWGGLHPEMMDALVPIASVPTPIAGRNLLWRQIIVRAIRSDPAFQARDFDKPFEGCRDTWPLFALMTSSVARLQDLRTAADVALFLDETGTSAPSAVDLLFALEASHDYDPRPLLHRIRCPLLAINFADDEVNPPALDLLGPALRAVPSASALQIDASDETDGHQTLNQAGAYAKHVTGLLAQTGAVDAPPLSSTSPTNRGATS